MSFKWFLAYLVLQPLFGFIFGARVYGKNNVPRKGRLIICANHTSFWDPPLVGWAVFPREVNFLAKIDLFVHNRLFAWLIKTYNAVPINRINSLKALRIAQNLISENKALVIFPEGTRNRTKDRLFLPFKDGAALLALKTNTNILPIFLKESKGSFWDWVFRKRQLIITIGKLIDTSCYAYNKTDIKALTNEIKQRMTQLAQRS